jgi:protein-L-isoaspartate(D-aspartate) O-methyltransferase
LREDDSIQEAKEKLIQHYIRNGYLKSKEVIRAIKTVPREGFIGDNPKSAAYRDRPLSIFANQTISAPHMVIMMVEEDILDLKVGDICLEIGAGSGYHAAVIAEIIAPSNVEPEKWGHVYAIERIGKLVTFARQNLENTGYDDRVTIIEGDGSLGYPEKAPYDKISVACAAPEIPQPLIDQLKNGGRLVIPVGGKGFFQSLVLVRKTDEGKIKKKSLSGVSFVPMVGKHGWEF